MIHCTKVWRTNFLAGLIAAGLAPYFSAQHAMGAAFDNANWVGMGGYLGFTEFIGDMAVDGAGNLYIGGLFSIAGTNAVNNIAKWDGNDWSALGSGVNGSVQALAVDGAGNLYVGGSFSMAGGIAANSIAKWNGSKWS